MRVPVKKSLLILLILCCGVTISSAASYLYIGPALPIPAGGGSSGTTISTINVLDNFLITDVTVTVDIAHSWLDDLDISIGSPAGTTVLLFDHLGGSSNDIPDSTFADGGAAFVAGTSGTWAPAQPLSLLAGESSLGLWTLTINDDADLDTGLLYSWSLNFAGGAEIPEPTTMLLVGLGLGGLLFMRRRSATGRV
jgi:subtilisin-like proprotein convertase family protein